MPPQSLDALLGGSTGDPGAAGHGRGRHPRRSRAPPARYPRRGAGGSGAERADRPCRSESVPGLQPDRLFRRRPPATSGAPRWRRLHRQGFFFGFGPSFSWNILNYGQITNNVRVQDAKLQGLLVDYQNAVLKAQKDVEDGLAKFLQNRRNRSCICARALPPRRPRSASR